jgi:hypothetical protein
MNTPPALRGSADPLKLRPRFTIRAGRTFEWNHDWPFYEARHVQLVNTNVRIMTFVERKTSRIAT